MTNSYIVTLPDGETVARRSHNTYTHVVAVASSARTAIDLLDRGIREFADDAAFVARAKASRLRYLDEHKDLDAPLAWSTLKWAPDDVHASIMASVARETFPHVVVLEVAR